MRDYSPSDGSALITRNQVVMQRKLFVKRNACPRMDRIQSIQLTMATPICWG